MNRNFLFALLLLSAPVLKAQTNLFNVAGTGNGDFESGFNAIAFNQSMGSDYSGWTLTQTTEQAYSGSHSMKCVVNMPGIGFRFLASQTVTTHQANTKYVVRAKVYVPSSASPVLGSDRWIQLGFREGANTGDVSYCNAKFRGFNTVDYASVDDYDEWVDIYAFATLEPFYVSAGDPLFFYVFLADGVGTFYIDKIEVFAVTSLNQSVGGNATIDYETRSIVLNPNGGVPGAPFTYAWSDGFTGKDRSNLNYGNYSVTISQDLEKAICPFTPRTLNFKFLAPPVVTANPSGAAICAGTGSITLTADVGEGTITWYDALTGGNQVGTGQSITINRAIGQYDYYAQRTVSGTQASARTKKTVTFWGPLADVTLQSNAIYTVDQIQFNVSNHQSEYNYRYQIQLPNGTSTIINTATPSLSWQPPMAGQYSISVRVTDSHACIKDFSFSVSVTLVIPLCSSIVPKGQSGELKLDKFSGQVVFNPSSTCIEDFALGCIGGKVEGSPVHNVVSASATTFSDRWSTSHLKVAQPSGLNSFEKSERGKWRSRSTHTFNKSINYQANDKNYQAGRFQLAHFNWKYPDATQKTGWLQISSITKYTPDGSPVEERNALNIASTAKFGYGGSVPYLIAQNAEFGSVYFEGFEYPYNNNTTLEEGVALTGSLTAADYHSGKRSLALSSTFTSVALTVNSQMRQKGLQVRFWAKGFTSGYMGVSTTAGGATTLKQIASSGEWALLESIISSVPANATQLSVSVVKFGGATVWIDDLRIQPLDAEMTCYVYDNRNLQLLTVFDDQHFGLFYQYNAEGKLIRKMVETERGLKTIQETQYNVPTVAKTPGE